MSNHARRRPWHSIPYRLSRAGRLDLAASAVRPRRATGSSKRRARAIRRALYVHQQTHSDRVDPSCRYCATAAQEAAQSPVGRS